MDTGTERRLTEEGYWDSFWRNPFGASANRFSFFYRVLTKKLLALAPPSSSAIELGCGSSVWLPTLASSDVDAWGIDFSDEGVAAASAALARQRVRATVIKGDVFDRDALPEGRFDLVFSLGLIEHFGDCGPLVERTLALAKPGGFVLTSVPNLSGWWGPLQRRLDRTIFDAHRAFVPSELDAVHVAGGLEIVEPAAYFGGVNPLIVNYNSLLDAVPRPLSRAALGVVWAAQQAICWLSCGLPQRLKNPPQVAGHILGVYRRPPESSGLAV